MKMFKGLKESYHYIKEAKQREIELSARLEESEKRIEARRKAWYEANGMTYHN